MSFFGYRSSSSSRATQHETHLSELERLRGRQLASLVRAGGRAKNQQQTTFEVAVAETSRGPLALVVTLPSDFPVRAPQVKVSIPLQHKLLDAAGNVSGHADLNHWTAHSDLGRIVTEIANELRVVASSTQTNQPPPVSPARRSSSPGISLSSSAVSLSSSFHGATSRYSSPSVKPPQTPPSQPPPAPVLALQRSQMPVIPAVFPGLEELSLSQLENIAQDRRALKAFAKDLDSVKEFYKLRDDVMSKNMEIAKKTLSYEEELRALQKEVQELRAELRESQQSLAAKQARQQRIVSSLRPDALLDQLSAATRDSDAASDDIANQFVHGELDVAQFLAQYLPERNRYHERTLKLTRVLQH